ncbi:DEAD/DEAH box helicase [Bacteriovorax sp. DB6_IX]|uniref:DEAD/DEAH box helicase n=1 Tax=Bacteriovorax sp. DB6_IX TaxID=1353530 RepID=UPI000389FFB4|nr:DEAD/DEAH box helicase [Bacteriovorax sp. DB6_IX]EQC50817.1 DEAD/DEAH box helicase [Bacteriovorax sp. DB6_IX]
MNKAKFSDFNLDPLLLKSLTLCEFVELREIQEKTLGPLLKGRNLIGISQTGTGKSAAFAIPTLDYLLKNQKKKIPFHTRVLVLCPTRELASQIQDKFRFYSKAFSPKIALLTGGAQKKKQLQALERGVEIIIATPGRLIDLIKAEKVFLENTETLILDEADKMLELGFRKDIEEIIELLKNRKQTILFSATMDEGIRNLTKQFIESPVEVEQSGGITVPENIQHVYYAISHEDRFECLRSILKRKSVQKAMIFVNTKKMAIDLSEELEKVGLKNSLLHGDLDQKNRDYAVRIFKKDKVRYLIATDVAARGIDFDDITMVINYIIPSNAESYVHRVGRAGRGDFSARAISLIDLDFEKESSALERIETLLQQKIARDDNHRFSKN